MKKQFKVGDLVGIGWENQVAVGLVVAILRHSKQEPLWNTYSVLCEGWIDTFPQRSLKKIEKSMQM